MNFYATFSIPFIVGVVTMFVVLIVKYGSWIFGLSAADRMRIVKGIPSRQTPLAVWEVVRESLLHRRIFKVNPLLGYMHMSLAFGWFLLIVVGWIETVAYLAPVQYLSSVQGAQGNRNRHLAGIIHQNQRIQKLIPGIDEGVDGRG